jgi:hypothetical protein
MKLSEYFETAKGHGVLATADSDGHVGIAIYASPHIIDEETVAFIMPDRLTHHNLQSNSHAAYLFQEDGPGYKGKRLYLSKIREEQDSELLHSIRRKSYIRELAEKEEPRFLVFFKIDKELPLIGTGRASGK